MTAVDSISKGWMKLFPSDTDGDTVWWFLEIIKGCGNKTSLILILIKKIFIKYYKKTAF